MSIRRRTTTTLGVQLFAYVYVYQVRSCGQNGGWPTLVCYLHEYAILCQAHVRQCHGKYVAVLLLLARSSDPTALGTALGCSVSASPEVGTTRP